MPDIGEYLERKKEIAEKEKEFMDGIERAERFIEQEKFDDAIAIYVGLKPLAEDMKLSDKLSILLARAREGAARHETEGAARMRAMELKKRKDALYRQALDTMGQASDDYKAKRYESALERYASSLEVLREIEASREIQIVNESIQKVKKEMESERVRELQKKRADDEARAKRAEEEKKMTLQREAEDRRRRQELDKMKRLGEKKAREDALVESAMASLDKANKNLKQAKGDNFLSLESKKNRYNDAIEAYEEAAEQFLEVNWVDEADKIKETAYKVKKERDADLDRFAKILARKQDKSDGLKGVPLAATVSSIKVRKPDPLLDEKVEEKRKREAAFAALNEASQMLNKFEKKSKVIGGQLFKENEYPEIERMYSKALGLFKEIGWMDEAARIEESVEILKKKEEDFLVEKAAFESRKAQSVLDTERDLDDRQRAALARLRRDTLVKESAKAKKLERKEIQSRVDKHLDKAMKHFKNDDLARSEQEYLEAHALMVDAGWDNEARSVMDTIEMIRGKLQSRQEVLLQKEREVDETGSFTRGVEQITETMGMIQEQEALIKEQEKKLRLEKKQREKNKQDLMFDLLADAQAAKESGDYARAVLSYHRALKHAEDLKWTSQIRDITDFMIDARKQKELQEKRLAVVRKRQESADMEAKAKVLDAEERVLDEKKKEQAARDLLDEREGVRASQQQKQESMFALLAAASEAMKQKDYDGAISKFQDALFLAEDLSWASQVRDITDFITDAKAKRSLLESQVEKHKETMEDRELISRKIRAEAETAKDVKVAENVVSKKGADKEVADLAYSLLDDANALHKNNQKQEALGVYESAMKKFDSIGWTRERDAVLQQVRKIEEEMKEEEAISKKQEERQKTQKAYDAITDAERCIRGKETENAIACYERALEIFESVEWTKEAAMVRDQISKVRANMERKLIADTTLTEKAKSEEAYALLDKARLSKQNRKIFKAVEYARNALSLFESLGDEWSRETGQVKKFVDELEREKRRKEELIKKLKMGDL
ncbi:MAG: hypothetical protein ACTSUE_02095 [Promethearchaeota archaeon]